MIMYSGNTNTANSARKFFTPSVRDTLGNCLKKKPGKLYAYFLCTQTLGDVDDVGLKRKCDTYD